MNLTISWINSCGEPLVRKDISGVNLGDTVNISPVIPEITIDQGDLTAPVVKNKLQAAFLKEVAGIRIQIRS